jgi:predicted DNA-binding protein (MmcQ/YjbR family)
MNIEKIRQLCLQMSHTTEGIKYGDQLCFMVAGKSFCSAQINKLEKIKFKVPSEDFEEICEKEGIAPAPYGGAKFKWVQVDDFHYLTEKEWLFYINQSYNLIKATLPKKVLDSMK